MISRRAFLHGVTAVGAVHLLTGCAGGVTKNGDDLGFFGTVIDPPFLKPTTQLTDLDGRPYDFGARTAGQLSLLLFGYTSCPDVCPRHLGILAETLPGLSGPAGRTNVIFVGVDTRRDTPTRMREYLGHFDKDFIGLTGTPDAIAAAMTELRLPPVVFDQPDADGNYSVGHPSQIFAFTHDNLTHVMYPFGTRQENWAVDLPRLVTQTWPST